MKKTAKFLGAIALLSTVFFSCSKSSSSSENNNISTPPLQIGQAITSTNLGVNGQITAVKGTMLTTAGTYNVLGDLVVNKGDTLYLQPGVTVCVQNKATIVVKGVLVSNGSQAQPNSFTVCSATKTTTIAQGANPGTDNAYQGLWTGINCDTTCTLLCLKWTHVEFAGGVFDATVGGTFNGGTAGKNSYAVLFQNLNGDCIIEDSWFYGNVDDCIRVQYGHLSIMRNTFEKSGFVGGDVVNMKSGAIGDCAYNVIIGGATNGTKASNKGTEPVECNINMYNNTYIDCGYRQAGQAGRGGSINYEQGAEGMAYNNLIVNCRVGLRIVNNPVADTTNCHYGNNFAYADSDAVCNQFYPVGYYTKDIAYVVPSQKQVDSLGYTYSGAAGSSAYTGSYFTTKNNPKFKNFPLPVSGAGFQNLSDIACTGSFDFHLAANSPCIGNGYTNFNPIRATKVTKAPFAATVTAPGVDIGAYQSNGSGNQH